MKSRLLYIHSPLLLFTLAAALVPAPVNAQTPAMPQSAVPQNAPQQDQPAAPGMTQPGMTQPGMTRPEMTQPDRDDITRRQVANFDGFLDSHPEVAQALQKDPSLINNQEFVNNHPELQQYLQQHPEIREELSQNPNLFMRDERRFDRSQDRDDRGRPGISAGELANMDKFLDAHPEIAEQLQRNPKLIDDKQFVNDHPALQQFLATHTGVREEFEAHPELFMHDEDRYDRVGENRGGGNRNRPDISVGELANMDKFLDSHPEIAEQLQKNPKLIDDKKFVDGHPALQQFLATHTGVREEFDAHPYAFMHDEDRYDRREDHGNPTVASFGGFLAGHERIANELSRNPSLANNSEYLANHSELGDYLNANPEVKQQVASNPQSFVQSAQQFNASKNPAMPKVANESKPK